MQLREQKLVQTLPDTGLLPRPQPPPGRHPTTETELLRQMLPADPGVEHEQDSLQRQPIIERLATRIAKAAFLPWQERLDPLPQRIRDLPWLRPHRHPPPTLTTGADGLRYPQPGPFIQLELLRGRSSISRLHRPDGPARPSGDSRLLEAPFRRDVTRRAAS